MNSDVGVCSVVIVSFFAGIYFMGTLGREIERMLEESCAKRSRTIRLKRYKIGNDEFNISLFEVKNQVSSLQGLIGIKPLRQIYHVQDMAKMIVGLIIGHDMFRMYNEAYRMAIQTEVDAFVANLERYNEFLKQPEVVVLYNFDEASRELKEANQPILDRLGALRNEVIEHRANGEGYPLLFDVCDFPGFGEK